jgi:hypothetical protein
VKFGRGSLPHGREGPWVPQPELGRRQAENPTAADFLSTVRGGVLGGKKLGIKRGSQPGLNREVRESGGWRAAISAAIRPSNKPVRWPW